MLVMDTGRRNVVVIQLAAVPKMSQLRRRRMLTQQALAKESGVSQGTIARIEAGHRTDVQFRTMQNLAKALGVEPSDVDEFRPSLGLDA